LEFTQNFKILKKKEITKVIDKKKILSLIEAIHLAVSRVNCFDLRHILPLFWLSVLAESLFSQYKVDFVYQCVILLKLFLSVNCYVSWLVCVAICASRSHSVYFLKNGFPCCLLFSRPNNLQKNGPREEKGDKESMKKGGTHIFLLSLFFPRSCKFSCVDWIPRE
jgi:hypothetical protein